MPGFEPRHLRQWDRRLGIGVSATGFPMLGLPTLNLGRHCPLPAIFLSSGMNLSAAEILLFAFTSHNFKFLALIEAHL